MTIKELHDHFDISVRAYNVCVNLGLNTIDDLRSFFDRNGTFKIAKNCGTKTDDELRDIVAQYGSNNVPDRQTSQEVPLGFQAVEDLDIFNEFVRQTFCGLSVRARNALIVFFDGSEPKFDSMKTEFLKDSFSALNLKNVGSLTSTEITEFKKTVFEFYVAIQNNSLTSIEKKRIKLKSIVGFDCGNQLYIDKFAGSSFPLISFTNDYLKEIFNLKKIDVFILKNHFHLLNKKYTLEEVAKEFRLTRERIRQKLVALIEDIEIQSKSLVNLFAYTEYEVLLDKNFIVLETLAEPRSLQEEINSTSPVFASYFLSKVMGKAFYCFGELNKFRRPDIVQYYDKYEEVKRVKGSYLISTAAFPKNELLKVYKFLMERFCERRGETEEFKIQDIVGFEITDEKLQILIPLVQKEFGITVSNGNIIFPRNTHKLVFEYAVEALEKLNRPAHISEILEEVIALHPDYDSGEDALRGSIGRYKDIFIYFGRSSTYGLKSWENKKRNIKGGTIKGIIEEYLQEESEPKHISDVLNYLRKFRDTNYNSVVTNLKVDPKKKFKFFGNGYIGLVSKQYKGSAFGIEVKTAGEIEWEKILELIL